MPTWNGWTGPEHDARWHGRGLDSIPMTETLPVDPALVEEAAALDEEAAAARHAELVEQVDRANRLYHEEDAPELSDADYDQLFRRLVALEAAWPALVTPDSPTQKVGGTPSGGRFPEVRHQRPMLSLSNAFSRDELAPVLDRLLGPDRPPTHRPAPLSWIEMHPDWDVVALPEAARLRADGVWHAAR